MLARLGRVDVKLLEPVTVRAEDARLDLTLVRARAAAIEARTQLVNAVRGLAKATGHEPEKCSPPCFHKSELHASLEPSPRGLLVLRPANAWLVAEPVETQVHEALAPLADRWLRQAQLLGHLELFAPPAQASTILARSTRADPAVRLRVSCSSSARSPWVRTGFTFGLPIVLMSTSYAPG